MEQSQSANEILAQLAGQSAHLKEEALRSQLADYVNYLLLHDFGKLLQLLYTVDIPEEKLKKTLSEKPGTDAAVLITDLLIQRQKEKNERKNSCPSSGNIPEEEKW